jgi:helicase MOV-10
LLIVVGNANLLSLDPLWRTFLNYVHTNGGWRGKRPSWDTKNDVDQDSESYSLSARQDGIGKTEEMLIRLKALIKSRNAVLDGISLEDDVFEENDDYGDEDIAVFRRENE